MKHAIHTLIRKRRELTCHINTLADELAALDAVLRMLDPDINLEAIPALRAVNRPLWADKGEVTRAVFAVLRHANGPMATDAITCRVADMLGHAVSARLRKSVYKALDSARLRGNVERDGVGPWQIVRPPSANSPSSCG